MNRILPWMRALPVTEPLPLAVGAAALIVLLGAGALLIRADRSKTPALEQPPRVENVLEDPTLVVVPPISPVERRHATLSGDKSAVATDGDKATVATDGDKPTGATDRDKPAIATDQAVASRGAKPDLVQLRDLMNRGVATFGSALTDDERRKGAELLFSAASQGFRPARDLVVHNYPRSQIVRSVVPVADVVQFALEPLASDALAVKENKERFIILANHFAVHGLVKSFAGEIVRDLRDDRRLQTPERLDVLLNLLSTTRGTCTAIAHIIAQSRAIEDPECTAALRDEILGYVSAGSIADSHVPPAAPPSQPQDGVGDMQR